MAKATQYESTVKKEMAEIRESFRKSREEDQRRREDDKRRWEEDQRRWKEWERQRVEWERQSQETNHKIAQLSDLFSNQWGKLVEALAEGSAVRLMKDWGLDQVNRTIPNLPGHYKGKDREFDIVVINGNKMVVLEAKTTLKQPHVDRFLLTMQDFKNYCPEYKALKVYAGVAYIKSGPQVQAYAERKGLFVIRSVGDNALLMNKKSFKPKEFP